MLTKQKFFRGQFSKTRIWEIREFVIRLECVCIRIGKVLDRICICFNDKTPEALYSLVHECIFYILFFIIKLCAQLICLIPFNIAIIWLDKKKLWNSCRVCYLGVNYCSEMNYLPLYNSYSVYVLYNLKRVLSPRISLLIGSWWTPSKHG